MTEDGRIHRMAALCSRSLSLLRGWGKSDAQLDAVTSSLWLVSAMDPARALSPCFENDCSTSGSDPRSRKRDLGHPPPLKSDTQNTHEMFRQTQRWRCGASDSAIPGFKVETWATLAFSDFAFLEEIAHEDLPGK